ncbi:hypothetical protein [Salsuginibacillus kocurii]|uniref:hypothetical protein n=1 Tax=Salsuginibacillus kocurii TaxID=427078 RepID=UPI0003812E1F|nr:hypothetical protein [Salsuginibacillus kocurii]
MKAKWLMIAFMSSLITLLPASPVLADNDNGDPGALMITALTGLSFLTIAWMIYAMVRDNG